jgi:VWFA-related protein
MAPVTASKCTAFSRMYRLVFAVTILAVTLGAAAQSNDTQSSQPQSQQNSQSQDIPDAPSAVKPPAPKPQLETPPPGIAEQGNQGGQSQTIMHRSAGDTNQQPASTQTPTQPLASPRNQINPAQDLYKLVVSVNTVMLPVTVKDTQGRPVYGLLPKDFTVLENGKKQNLTYFTSDPFELSVAVVLDTGMSDASLQKVNETYSALMGAFSPYDEVALYTFSSTVSQVSDFTGNFNRLNSVLNEVKLTRGHNNGPAVLGGPLGPQPPMVNGMPVGSSGPPPIYTPPRESHVLNDAILRAALDLSKREKTRRKVIFVIADGRELGSRASYRDVLRVLQTRDIQVRAVVVGSGALPVYRQLEKFRIKDQGYGNLLPKYCRATGGGGDQPELTRIGIEDAYAQITSDARNQYTLGYNAQPTTGSSAYRTVEVLVDHKGLNIYARDGYYPIPQAH